MSSAIETSFHHQGGITFYIYSCVSSDPGLDRSPGRAPHTAAPAPGPAITKLCFLYPGEMVGWRGQECRHCQISLVLDRHQTSSEIIDQVIIFSFPSPVSITAPGGLLPVVTHPIPDSICSSLHCVGYGVIYCDILRCAAAAKLKMDHGVLLTTLWETDFKEDGRQLQIIITFRQLEYISILLNKGTLLTNTLNASKMRQFNN